MLHQTQDLRTLERGSRWMRCHVKDWMLFQVGLTEHNARVSAATRNLVRHEGTFYYLITVRVDGRPPLARAPNLQQSRRECTACETLLTKIGENISQDKLNPRSQKPAFPQAAPI